MHRWIVPPLLFDYEAPYRLLITATTVNIMCTWHVLLKVNLQYLWHFPYPDRNKHVVHHQLDSMKNNICIDVLLSIAPILWNNKKIPPGFGWNALCWKRAVCVSRNLNGQNYIFCTSTTQSFSQDWWLFLSLLFAVILPSKKNCLAFSKLPWR